MKIILIGSVLAAQVKNIVNPKSKSIESKSWLSPNLRVMLLGLVGLSLNMLIICRMISCDFSWFAIR